MTTTNTPSTPYPRKHLWVIAWLIVCLISPFPTLAKPSFEREVDSLEQITSSGAEPAVLIPTLRRLAKLYDKDPKRVLCLRKQYELASRIESHKDMYDALENISNYYYNQLNQRDSLLYWCGIIDSIAQARKEYPNALFVSKSYSCKDLIWKRDYETALEEAQALNQLAYTQKHTYGLIRSSECLGLLFRVVGRHKEAVAQFQIVFDLLDNFTQKQLKENQITQSEALGLQLRVVSLQFESSCRENDYEQAEAIAARYLSVIKKQERLNKEKGDNYPTKREYWLYYSLYIDFYTRQHKLEQAKRMIACADRYDGNLLITGDYVTLVNWFSKASYYRATKERKKAHYYIDKILERERVPDELQLKADILKEEGQLGEVLCLYDEMYQYDLEKNNETFLRQVNQLRTLHEIREREVQKQELEYAKQLMAQKQEQLLVVFSVIAVSLLLLYVLYSMVRRTQRLKMELMHEKEALLRSEERLIQERERAERTSRMKSTFVANMSHEIRTPLNAIVGFSGLLVHGEVDQEDKEAFSLVIKNNTDLLLTLLNDVLDLSRMETGDMLFKMADHALEDCCRRALDSVRYRIPEGVNLTFTPDPRPVLLNTDTMRLQQLLTNFLTNAAKFTLQGEINLSYQLLPSGDRVSIFVTDTGCGVPVEKQETIFKRFEKLDDYQPGAGLGLSICSIIADRLGGSIGIDESYTAGARFVFIHPCKQISPSFYS